jgi:hypothetical protein
MHPREYLCNPEVRLENAREVEKLAKRLQSEGAQYFLVSNDAMRSALDLHPFGIDLRWIDVMKTHEQEWSVFEFLRLYNLIDSLAFGQRGLGMPHWVMVDLAVLPSAITIIAWPKERLLEEVRSGRYRPDLVEGLMDVVRQAEDGGYDGPIPFAAYCAVPTAQSSRWVGWSLWSFVTGYGFATVAKGLALKTYRAAILDGVTQYDNVSLRIHTKFGSLRLRSAFLDIHTAAHSFVYESDVVSTLRHAHEPTFWMDSQDIECQKRMQKCIDEGTSDFYIVAPGIVREGETSRVPILEVPID